MTVVTIKDVAKVAGVSTATVSRVVNGQGKVGEQCRKRVQKVIEQLGYRPNGSAQALVRRELKMVGVITPKLSMTFFGTLAAGAEEMAREQGYSLIMCNSLYETQSELDAIDSLRRQGCQSIILHSEYSDDAQLIELAEEIPGLVLINRFIPQIAQRCVWFDNLSASQQATRYLVERGHTEIAVISSIYQNGDPADRVVGTRQALQQHGLDLKSDRVIESTANIDGGKEATEQLIASGQRFTAIVAYNDLMAIGAMQALHQHGIRVPDDVSLIGFDNLPIARACIPSLTTMNYPVEEMARYAVELSLILARKEHPHTKQTHLFISELIERETVRNLRVAPPDQKQPPGG